MVTTKKVIVIWLLWFIIWPVILWLSYHNYYVAIENQLIDVLLFALFMGIVAWFPVIIRNNPIFFINGISLAVFLIFGLFVEMILTQITIIIVLLKTGVGKRNSYRYPLNMLMFSIVSIIAAGVFNLFGGSHETISAQSHEQITAIFGYASAVFLVNTILNVILDKLFYRRDIKLLDEGVKWEFFSALFTIPVGYVLFALYTEIGRSGIFYLGIPFVFISIILRLLYSYQEINRYLEKTGDIGHQLTNRMDLANVYDVFIQEVSHLLPVDYTYIFMVDKERLVLERFEDVRHHTDPSFRSIERNATFSETVWTTGKPVLNKNAADWFGLENNEIPSGIESVLSLPIEYGDSIIGVVTLESNDRNAFGKMHYQVMTILNSYLGVAVENAKNYETTKLKSERDGLTNLYNLNYLEDILDNHFAAMERGDVKESSSLLILDLDYFKQVNDTYGHEAGNEILCTVADRLSSFISNNGIIARYGGEEFVVFLPGIGLSEAVKLAESLRTTLFERPFRIQNYMLDYKQEMAISVTASIGVASYPENCETSNELIRHADRAMYIGAKRKGRNKVAVYSGLTGSDPH
ncbi:sensor domain-containing diguanylate cyclase [Lentibacillus salicampi]|uniref:Sensor domain-containing diguanylate cyclase n=1 Tax=Lentibacillus salicampi TaxID=175306 RepID=A0A4Y9AHV2_9BACI|nr:diguanylate cyclase [Lentibacillus salicampi]TFJ93984.1 sensor domain-containing diguanylate cyclase [Lentibacillus salicampi]